MADIEDVAAQLLRDAHRISGVLPTSAAIEVAVRNGRTEYQALVFWAEPGRCRIGTSLSSTREACDDCLAAIEPQPDLAAILGIEEAQL